MSDTDESCVCCMSRPRAVRNQPCGTSLTLTSLPDGITSIGAYAFYECTSLALTSLPDGLTSIGDRAFFGCTSLVLANLPDGLTSIGNQAFEDSTSLALTSLPDGLTSIGDRAFEGCISLAPILIIRLIDVEPRHANPSSSVVSVSSR